MKEKVIIFDFDGTIADVVPIFRKIYAELATQYKLPEVTDEDFYELRKKNLKQVLKWAGIRYWQLPSILSKGRTMFAHHKKEAKLFDGVPEIINKLHDNKCDIYVLSSNSEATIKNVLERYKVADKVTILKRPSLFGKSRSINKLVSAKKYDKANVWMVGDEVRDVEAGNKAKVNTISVSWGLQDGSLLAQQQPTYLVDTVSQLKEILTSS